MSRAEAMSYDRRLANYRKQIGRPDVTPRQIRRLRKKGRHARAKAAMNG